MIELDVLQIQTKLYKPIERVQLWANVPQSNNSTTVALLSLSILWMEVDGDR